MRITSLEDKKKKVLVASFFDFRSIEYKGNNTKNIKNYRKVYAKGYFRLFDKIK